MKNTKSGQVFLFGLQKNAIGKWECGKRIPELDNLIKLANAFDVSLDIFRQDSPVIDLPHPHFKR